MENMLKYDFMKYRHRLLYYRVAPIYTRYALLNNLINKNKLLGCANLGHGLLLSTTKKKTELINVISVP